MLQVSYGLQQVGADAASEELANLAIGELREFARRDPIHGGITDRFRHRLGNHSASVARSSLSSASDRRSEYMINRLVESSPILAGSSRMSAFEIWKGGAAESSPSESATVVRVRRLSKAPESAAISELVTMLRNPTSDLRKVDAVSELLFVIARFGYGELVDEALRLADGCLLSACPHAFRVLRALRRLCLPDEIQRLALDIQGRVDTASVILRNIVETASSLVVKNHTMSLDKAEGRALSRKVRVELHSATFASAPESLRHIETNLEECVARVSQDSNDSHYSYILLHIVESFVTAVIDTFLMSIDPVAQKQSPLLAKQFVMDAFVLPVTPVTEASP